ncbi:MAG: DHH family phosphoesterase [Candidatus Gracilibacteria bacterium]
MECYLPENLKTEFFRAKKALFEANKICIVSHKSPDGDAVGSNLALRMGLEALGKTVTSACVDVPPQNSMFLKGAADYVTDFNYEDFDAIVSVDCGDLKLFKFHEKKPEVLSGSKPFINFDHHESNNNFGTINPVDPRACATCFIMYKFFKFCGWTISIDVATALLHGIYFDTGSLMHSNTDAEVYKAAGELAMRGADLKRIAKELFHTTPVNRLRLWGKIMERTYVNDEMVTVSAANKADYEACGTTSKDNGGVIDYLNAIPGSNYCVLLSEDDNGLVKGSLRTQRNDINLSDVASKWGGGGHPKASGFGLEGRLQPMISWRVVKEGAEGAHEIEF